jgi:cation transport ATPase
LEIDDGLAADLRETFAYAVEIGCFPVFWFADGSVIVQLLPSTGRRESNSAGGMANARISVSAQMEGLKQRSTATGSSSAKRSQQLQQQEDTTTRSLQDPRTKGIPTYALLIKICYICTFKTLCSHVVLKLIIFSVLMIVAPIGTYFWTYSHIFNGNATYSALAAVAMTNIIMISYVCVAFLEDRGDSSTT